MQELNIFDLKDVFKNKYFKYFILGIAVICIMILIFPTDKKEKNITTDKKYESSNYIEELELKIKTMVEHIEDAGKATVILSCKDGEENIYATENEENTKDYTYSENGKKEINKDSKEKIIILKEKGGGETPLIVKKIPPEITGAVIICEGADNKKVERMIIEAVSVALNMKTNNITVLKSDK